MTNGAFVVHFETLTKYLCVTHNELVVCCYTVLQQSQFSTADLLHQVLTLSTHISCCSKVYVAQQIAVLDNVLLFFCLYFFEWG